MTSTRLKILLFFVAGSFNLIAMLGAVENSLPQVNILWPKRGDAFSVGIFVKIKVEVQDFNQTVTEVRFFADNTLIGIVTNPPFNVVWQVMSTGTAYGTIDLRAIAVDNLGATVASPSVPVTFYTGGPPAPVVHIVSPPDRAVFPILGTTTFAAEVLASAGDAGPVEFFVDGTSVGITGQGQILTATTANSLVIISNLAEGQHGLTVRYRGANGNYCGCVVKTNTIRVVKLGIQSPRLTTNRFQFEVVTSFPEIETVIEAAPDLLSWAPVSTNQSPSNTFVFTDSSPTITNRRFYRVVLPSQEP